VFETHKQQCFGPEEKPNSEQMSGDDTWALMVPATLSKLGRKGARAARPCSYTWKIDSSIVLKTCAAGAG